MNRVVGTSAIALAKNSPDNNLSIFFADAVAASCKQRNAVFDFAFPTTNGGIRNSMPKGDWTLRNIYELMPFENECVLLTISGKKINSLVDFIILKGGQPLAGITIQAIAPAAPIVKINGLAVDTNRNYIVLTSDYLANGGDGIIAFAKPINKVSLHYKIRDAILDYVQSQQLLGKTINPNIDGRISIQQ
jgi:2',3'-cyclic-nucleotide 2'-phosphodiesterase (5'-nucleotidase family)